MNGSDLDFAVARPEFFNARTYLGYKTLIIMKTLLQINIPIHLVPFLIFKLKSLRTE